MNRYELIEELSLAIGYNRDLGLRAPVKILEHANTEASIHVTQHLIALQQLEQAASAMAKSISAPYGTPALDNSLLVKLAHQAATTGTAARNALDSAACLLEQFGRPGVTINW